MRQSVAIMLVFFTLCSSVAAVCDATQTASYLSEGTTYSTTAKDVDYMILIDTSGSMAGEKLDTVKAAATKLIGRLTSRDRAAVISFSTNATVDQSLTNDNSLLISSISGLQAQFGTNYAPPLRLAEKEFAASTKYKGLIFLSDGKSDFSETPEEIINITDDLARSGVCILTISYSLGGQESPLLEQMADTGKKYGCGDHFIASEKGDELENVFEQIQESLSAADLLSLNPTFSSKDYSFDITSRLNGRAVAGSSGTSCADEPDFSFTVEQGGKAVYTSASRDGPLNLPDGEYNYSASATLRCGGTCSIVGEKTGEFTIGGVCKPDYKTLATYVTGETQLVQITKTGFVPSTVSGRQGTLVVWTNRDIEPRHIVSSSFNEIIQPGDTFTYVIQNVGALVYSDPEHNFTGQVSALEAPGSDVLLVVDESGSMKGARIAEAQDAAERFFNLLGPTDRGALVSFSTTAQIAQDFTSDKQALIDAASNLRAESATNYLTAIEKINETSPRPNPVLVFMSDGVPTDPEGKAAILLGIDNLRKQGWCIMTIGFGDDAAQARDLLSAMAGEDKCSVFLYASQGKLAETFGTVYQLSQGQEDLQFSNLVVPFVSFTNIISMNTEIKTKTGNPVPGGTDLCSPAATIQAYAGSSSGLFVFDGKKYTGSLLLNPGINKIRLVAAVSASDEPARSFIGVNEKYVFFMPPWLASFLILLFAGILIYFIRWRQVNGLSKPATRSKN